METMIERPPYVTFEVAEEEDRNATIEAGHLVYREFHMAYITPQGSKDRIPRKVEEWFPQLQFEVQQGRFKNEWLRNYKEAYEAWKAGQEPPVNGTDLKMFPIITKQQLKACQSIGIRSLEDLAVCNEESLMRMGMGARELKAKAITFLDSSKNAGAVAEQFHALNTKLNEVIARNEVLERQVQELGASQIKEVPAKGKVNKEPETGISVDDILGFDD